MRVQHGTETYSFKFFYQPAEYLVEFLRKQFGDDGFEALVAEDDHDLFDANDPHDTVCTIERLVLDHENNVCGAEMIASEIAQISKHDKYDKLEGRKLAFQRAVDMIDDRELRTALWRKYLDTHYVRAHDGNKVKVSAK